MRMLYVGLSRYDVVHPMFILDQSRVVIAAKIQDKHIIIPLT